MQDRTLFRKGQIPNKVRSCMTWINCPGRRGR
jgi:hypothetical protein